MGEIDQVDDAVDHGVTQGHHGVHAAQHQTIDQLLQQGIDGNSPKGCAIVGKKKPSTGEGLRVKWGASIVLIDVHILGFLDEQHADHEGRTGDDDRVPQPVVHIASLRHDRKSCRG